MKLKDLFDIEYGQSIYHNKGNIFHLEKEGGIPLISSKGTDNGVYGYYDIKPKYKGCIANPLVGSLCEASYHGEDCCIDNNCLVLNPKFKLSDSLMLYYTTLIRMEKYKYMYGRQVTPSRLGETNVPDLLEAMCFLIASNKSRAEQSRAEQSRAEQSRAEQSRAYLMETTMQLWSGCREKVSL